MWSRLSLANPFDVLLVLVTVTLIAAALRRRRPLWEYAAGLGLAVATASAARHGIWLLLFLSVPAATAIHRQAKAPSLRRPSQALAMVIALVCAGGAATVLAFRAPSFRAADAESASIAEATRGQVVLVNEPLAESLAAAGATVWASNPLDAFAAADQAAYLAFMNGNGAGARTALDQADVVVARPGSAQAAAASAAGFTRVNRLGAYVLLTR